jgi:hypothetical protein
MRACSSRELVADGRGGGGGDWDVSGQRVLELGAGAGTGLAGLVAALSGAIEVVLSDYPADEVLANLRVGGRGSWRGSTREGRRCGPGRGAWAAGLEVERIWERIAEGVERDGLRIEGLRTLHNGRGGWSSLFEA